MKYKMFKKLVVITVLTILFPFVIKAQNPIVQTHFAPDPAPMIHNGTLYAYVGDDIPGFVFIT